MLYQEQVTVATPLQINVSGRYFLLDDTGAEATVDITLLRGGSPIFGKITGRKRGWKIGVENGFDGVRIEAAGTTIVTFFASSENVSISTTDGAEVAIPGGVEVTNTALNPVQVEVTGVVNLTASAVDVNNQPVTVAGAGYTVTAAGIAVSTVANANRRAIHFRNADSAVDCYLAAFAAVAKGNCPIILRAGDCLLIDDRSAAAAWVAFSDGADLSLVVQEVAE